MAPRQVLYDSGALLTRIESGTPADEWEMDPGTAQPKRPVLP